MTDGGLPCCFGYPGEAAVEAVFAGDVAGDDEGNVKEEGDEEEDKSYAGVLEMSFRMRDIASLDISWSERSISRTKTYV